VADIENGAEVSAQTIGAESGDAGTEASQQREDVLKLARERMRLASEAETEQRLAALDDQRFRAGEQWERAQRAEREADGRPCLTINRLPQLCNQVTNDQRQNRPAIKVHPVDSQATESTAEVIQGLIRHIEYNSNAESAYDTASDNQVATGRGFFRITTAYAAPDSFDQELYIKRVLDPMTVFFDPNSQEADGSDAQYAFIVEDMSREEYEARYPESTLSAPGAEWESLGLQAPAWFKDGSARVAEYFCKEWHDETIYLLGTGETVTEAELGQRQAAIAQANARGGRLDGSVKAKRKTRIPTIKWYKINGQEILEETTWPGTFIPIVPVYGAELVVNGKRILEGLIRHAKDAQRMLNYWKSAETETIALAPRAPYIAAEGQIDGYKHIWATANRKNHAYLPYKATAIGGGPVPPPQRQQYEPATQAITQAAMGAAEDLKGTTGVYDAGVGAQSNETAGVAIKARAGQVQTANFHFSDNFKRSLKHAGRILIEAIPHVYDTARAVRIIGADDSAKVVLLNQAHPDEGGKEQLYDVTTGRYDVTVDTGPSFASKREEAAEGMQEMVRAAPDLLKIAGDLLVKNMDWPGAQELAERLKKTLPPGLDDDPKRQQVPPQAQAQLMQQAQIIQQLTQNLNECTKVIETKKLELEHKERVELARIQAQLEMKAAELGSREDIALMNKQIEAIQQRMQLLHEKQQIEAQNDFNPEGADGGNYAGIGHIGGTENLTGGGTTPGQPMEGNP
jgi:hypothetical protein